MKSALGTCACLFLIATPAFAQDEQAKFGIGVTAGTLGVGPEISFTLSDKIAVRGNATFLSLNKGVASDDVDYDGKLKLESYGAMLDFHPTGGGFRISGGFRINSNRAKVEATPAAAATLNGTTYTPAQIGMLRGSAETKNLAPQLTIGYAKRRRGLSIGVDGGVLFQGKVRVKQFTASGGGVSAVDLEAERQSVQDDVDGYKLYPILQLSLGYRF